MDGILNMNDNLYLNEGIDKRKLDKVKKFTGNALNKISEKAKSKVQGKMKEISQQEKKFKDPREVLKEALLLEKLERVESTDGYKHFKDISAKSNYTGEVLVKTSYPTILDKPKNIVAYERVIDGIATDTRKIYSKYRLVSKDNAENNKVQMDKVAKRLRSKQPTIVKIDYSELREVIFSLSEIIVLFNNCEEHYMASAHEVNDSPEYTEYQKTFMIAIRASFSISYTHASNFFYDIFTDIVNSVFIPED